MFSFKFQEMSFTPPRPGEDLYTCSMKGELVSGTLSVGQSIGVTFGDTRKNYVMSFLRIPDGDNTKSVKVHNKPGPLTIDIKIVPAFFPTADKSRPAAGTLMSLAPPF